jgi:integrase
MEVGFQLKRPNSSLTSIYADISYEGYRMKYYISESINPKYWNRDNKRAKETSKFREHPEFNTRLDNLCTGIKNVYRRYLNDRNEVPNPSLLKTLLDQEFDKKVKVTEQPIDFFRFFENLISQSKSGTRLNPKTGKPISPNTVKTYNTTLKHLQNFQKIIKKKIDFETIDLDFYSDFIEYLTKEVRLSTNAIGKNIQILKLILGDAAEHGLNKNTAFKGKRFITIREKSESIYLNQEELNEIAALDLSENKKLEKVRDLFIIGCYTGLRFSDVSTLTSKNIKEGEIEITQIKTGDPVRIPCHSVVKKLLNKYDGEFPKAYSNQKTNEYLKEIGKKVESLKSHFSKSFTKAGQRATKNFPKWELLTTHTARRSFATNLYLAEVPPITIMAITGHRTEKAFMKYIKVTPKEHSKILKMYWEKEGNLNVI